MSQVYDKELRDEGKKIFFSFAIAYALFVLPLTVWFVIRDGMQFLLETFGNANLMLIMSLLLPLIYAPFAMMSFFEAPHGIFLLAYFGLIVCLRKFSVPFLQYKVLVPLMLLWLFYGIYCVGSLY